MDNYESILSCRVDMSIPTVTSQQKGHSVVRGKVHTFTKGSVQQAMKRYRESFYWDRPDSPFDDAIEVLVEFNFHKLKPSKLQCKQRYWPRSTKPDIDNLIKLFIDGISPDYFVNDSRICSVHGQKNWTTDIEHVTLTVRRPLPHLLNGTGTA